MATVILQDLNEIITVPVGTASAFREAINNNFTVLKDASQQLQNMVGKWDETEKGTIYKRLLKSSKLYIGAQSEYEEDVKDGLEMCAGDIWFKVLENE